MRSTSHIWISLAIMLLLQFPAQAADDRSRLLVASTQPLYLIAQAVTQGIEQPVLLIPAHQDGHHIQIRPQDRRLIQQADLVVWVGVEYEAALNTLLAGRTNAIALTDHPNHIKRLPARELNGQPRPNSLDPHLWLEPYNAIFTAHLIANIRSAQYPQDSTRYQHNAQIFTQKMQQTMRHTPPKTQPYWAYHDAYQYIERYAGIRLAAALTSDPELPPTAQQIQHLRQNRPNAVPCMFTEAHAPRMLIQRLMPVRHVLIDETMRDADDFIHGWTALRDQMQACVNTPK